MNHWLTPCEAILRSNEGRACELSRRASFAVLFTREGRPGAWLLLVAALWSVVAATALGTPG